MTLELQVISNLKQEEHASRWCKVQMAIGGDRWLSPGGGSRTWRPSPCSSTVSNSWLPGIPSLPALSHCRGMGKKKATGRRLGRTVSEAAHFSFSCFLLAGTQRHGLSKMVSVTCFARRKPDKMNLVNEQSTGIFHSTLLGSCLCRWT